MSAGFGNGRTSLTMLVESPDSEMGSAFNKWVPVYLAQMKMRLPLPNVWKVEIDLVTSAHGSRKLGATLGT